MRFIFDDGHGWLEVSLEEYPEALECGTGFGFIDSRKNVIYLEQDCEAAKFMKKYPKAFNSRSEDVLLNGYSHIRDLPRNEKMWEMSETENYRIHWA
jgi:hypothetical protein